MPGPSVVEGDVEDGGFPGGIGADPQGVAAQLPSADHYAAFGNGAFAGGDEIGFHGRIPVTGDMAIDQLLRVGAAGAQHFLRIRGGEDGARVKTHLLGSIHKGSIASGEVSWQ